MHYVKKIVKKYCECVSRGWVDTYVSVFTGSNPVPVSSTP